MSGYQEILAFGEEKLHKSGIEQTEAKSCAWILFSYCFCMSRIDFLMNCIEWQEMSAEDETHLQQYKELLKKRASGIPVQYLTHEQNFYGYDFYVDERVLIPRQDTEVLIECVEQMVAQELLRKQQMTAGTLLDLCTGSGCIAITLANVLKWDKVWASDISEDALCVAQQNNMAHGSLVEFRQGDLFAPFEQFKAAFDVIVSNPPYIESAVLKTLSKEVLEHEPCMALDGREDGLYFYRRIVKEASEYLKKEGLLFLEIGYNQGEAVKALCNEAGYENVRVVADLAGLDRVVCARYCGAGLL